MLQIRFTTDEVADLLRTEGYALRELVKANVVRPVFRGSVGPGRGHQFSAQQVLGLAEVIAYQQSYPRDVRAAFARAIVNAYEDMSDDLFGYFVGTVGLLMPCTPLGEEKWAAWQEANRSRPVPFWLEATPKVRKWIGRLQKRVATAAAKKIAEHARSEEDAKTPEAV